MVPENKYYGNARILLVAHDIGSGYAVLNYAKRINCKITKTYFDGPSRTLNTEYEREKTLTIDNFDLVVVGTSSSSLLELEIAAQANSHSIPVHACFDHWVNYKEKTRNGGYRLNPQKLIVYDSYAKEIVSNVFPDIPIAIIPDSRIKDLIEISHRFNNRPILPGTLEYSVFIDEPLSLSPVKYRYNEYDSLERLIKNDMVTTYPIHVVLHPSRGEFVPPYEFDDYIHILPPFGSRSELIYEIMFSKEVYGISSYALYESSYIHPCVYSVLNERTLKSFLPLFKGKIKPMAIIP
jgi:hypothetical protein